MWEGKVERPDGKPLMVVRFDLVTFLMWFARAEMVCTQHRSAQQFSHPNRLMVYSSQFLPTKGGVFNSKAFLVVWSFHEITDSLQKEIM